MITIQLWFHSNIYGGPQWLIWVLVAVISALLVLRVRSARRAKVRLRYHPLPTIKHDPVAVAVAQGYRDAERRADASTGVEWKPSSRVLEKDPPVQTTSWSNNGNNGQNGATSSF